MAATLIGTLHAMTQLSPTVDVAEPLRSADDRALPPVLLLLTLVTGLVDAVSYLGLGRVFVANMTGNVVFLGFATAGVAGFSVPASVVAIGAFFAGAIGGGRVASLTTKRRSQLVMFVVVTELLLVACALVTAISLNSDSLLFQYGLIVLLAISMGVQNAAARTLAVPDLTTTVLTLTLTGIGADSSLAGGTNPRLGRRLFATGAMFAGAAVGAWLAVQWSMAAPLGAATILLVLAATTCWFAQLAQRS